MPPELQQMLIFSLLNPAIVAVGLLMGRAADQAQKVVVGAFAAAIAGLVGAWIANGLGIPVGMKQPRNVAGLFVVSWVLGLLWSWVGFRWLKPRA
jgi:uncharacterized membrane protein YeaQ/YmgE (transglycosylase-associated protein family)